MINKKHTCDSLLLEESELKSKFEEYINDDKWSMTNYVHSIAGFNHLIHKEAFKKLLSELYFNTIQRNLEGAI